MKEKIKSEMIFWIGYFLIIFSEMFINVKLIGNYTEIINVIGLIFLIIYISLSMKHYSKKDFILMILLSAIALGTYFIHKNFTIMKFLIIVYCLKKISFDKLIERDFYIKLSLFIILLFISLLGFCNVTSFQRLDATVRYTLGFIHPNTAGFFIMILAFEYIYMHKDKMHIKEWLIIIIALIIINFTTDSRSSTIALILLSILLPFSKFFRNKILNSKIICFIIKNFMIILTILSIWVCIRYSNGDEWANYLDNKLSNRIGYLSNSLQTYHINAFGNLIPPNRIMDNQYISFLLNFGIVIYTIYYIIYYIKFNQLIKEKDSTLIILLLVLLVYGLMETMVFKASYNTFMLSLSSVLFMNKKKEESKEDE